MTPTRAFNHNSTWRPDPRQFYQISGNAAEASLFRKSSSNDSNVQLGGKNSHTIRGKNRKQQKKGYKGYWKTGQKKTVIVSVLFFILFLLVCHGNLSLSDSLDGSVLWTDDSAPWPGKNRQHQQMWAWPGSVGTHGSQKSPGKLED